MIQHDYVLQTYSLHRSGTWGARGAVFCDSTTQRLYPPWKFTSE